MIVAHPKAFTHVIVELLGPIRRGHRTYPAGYQLAAQGPLGETVVTALDGDGLALVVRADRLRVVSTPKATAAATVPVLSNLIARGVLRRASDLN